tara:strand:+ start:405 stop:716 length:312 start_codon:yes stop_codon:yes gene_type:complete
MIFFWLFYYLFLTIICYFFINTIKNKFIIYFFTPVLFGFFGAVWFVKPESYDLAPIFSILFLELSIIEFNGMSRLLRPLLTSIFILQLFSLLIYFYQKKIKRK